MRKLLCALATMLALMIPVHADDTTIWATGIFCDTEEQAALFGSLFDEHGTEGALKIVGDEFKDEHACVFASFGYKVVEKGIEMKIGGADYEMISALILAVRTPLGMQWVQPGLYYLLRPVQGQPA